MNETPSPPRKKRTMKFRTSPSSPFASPRPSPIHLRSISASPKSTPTKQGQGDNGCVLRGSFSDYLPVQVGTIDIDNLTVEKMEHTLHNGGIQSKMHIFPINKGVYYQDRRPRVIKFVPEQLLPMYKEELDRAVTMVNMGIDIDQDYLLYPIAAAVIDLQVSDDLKYIVRRRCSKNNARFHSSQRLYCFEMVQAKGTHVVKTLTDYPRDHFTESQAANIFAQTERLLKEKLYQKGLYHGDLHGKNVIVYQNPNNPDDVQVQLIDFSYLSDVNPVLVDQKRFVSQFIPELSIRTKEGELRNKLQCIQRAYTHIFNTVGNTFDISLDSLYYMAERRCQTVRSARKPIRMTMFDEDDDIASNSPVRRRLLM